VFTQIWSQLTGMNVSAKIHLIAPGILADKPTGDDVLHYIRLCHGRLDRQHPPGLLINSIRD
jgi:hypothetical protein